MIQALRYTDLDRPFVELAVLDGEQTTIEYGWDATWGDMLTRYGDRTLTYDNIGNMTSDGTYTYTWEHGRELSTMADSTGTWAFTYDANGMRTKKVKTNTSGSVTDTYTYVYNGSQLSQMTKNGNVLNFFYDGEGRPAYFTYNNATYYYVTNLQGDVVAILDSTGAVMVNYHYDAYGVLLQTGGAMATTLGTLNPLTYRGYVYDHETGLYYLQSRYYNPEIKRFISPDGQIAGVGGEINGYDLYEYCFNNPVNMYDSTGNWPNWGNLAQGTVWLTVGVAAVCVGVSVLTYGTATPIMVAVAAVTISAGALTAVNGAAEVGEAFTDYNVVRDTAFNGNQTAYDIYAHSTATVAELGMIAVGMLQPAAQPTGVCFIAGTLVLTACGTIAIEEINVGDMVWAEDPETGEKALKEVVQTFTNETTELIRLHVGGEEIITTPEHPFYSPVKGWTAACKLRAGDILVLQNGKYVVVEKVQHEILETPITVYNFEVADFHTYYVGENAVLVHNTCQSPKFTPDQQAVIELARENKKGLSRSEAEILVEWAKEYGIKSHAPMLHPKRSGKWSLVEHIKIFNEHIPIK